MQRKSIRLPVHPKMRGRCCFLPLIKISEYIKEEHPDWEIKNGYVFLQKAKETAPSKEIPSLQLPDTKLCEEVGTHCLSGVLLTLIESDQKFPSGDSSQSLAIFRCGS